MKIVCFQHVAFETPGYISTWAMSKGYDFSTIHVYKQNYEEHSLDTSDWLVIVGGSMSVNVTEKHSWLSNEKRLIESAIYQHKTVIGICLGAQLIADVLGARVYKSRLAEIGWHYVRKTPSRDNRGVRSVLPDVFLAFHWHEEMFELPGGATHLLSSDFCDNQGFVYNECVIALQCHLEITVHGITELVQHSGGISACSPSVQSADEILVDVDNRCACINHIMNNLLDYLSD